MKDTSHTANNEELEEQLAKHRKILKVTLLCSIVFCPLYMTLFSLMGAWWNFANATASALTFTGVFYFYRQNKIESATKIAATGFFIAPFVTVLFTGGLNSAMLVWLCITPLVIPMLFRNISTFLLVGTSSIFVIICGALHLSGVTFIDEIPQELHSIVDMSSMVGAFFLMSFIGRSLSLSYENRIEVQKKLLKEVETSRTRMQSILETVPVSVITIDRQGTIQSANRATQTIAGIEPKNLLGKNVKIMIPEKIREHHDSYIANHLNSGQNKVIGSGREVPVLHKDGHHVDAFLSIGKFMVSGETFFTGVLSDISELKQRERELQNQRSILKEQVRLQTQHLVEAKDLAEAASRAKSMFLANISHELRTPMHSVLSFSEIGTEQVDHADRVQLKEYFSEIHQMGSRLMTLLNDLLDLSKLQADKSNYYCAHQGLGSTVESIIGEMSLIAKNKNVQVTSNVDESVKAWFDEQKISQVLTNLLNNALKFCQERSEVVISTNNPAGSFLEISVSNVGPSIPEDERASIFDPFLQSSVTRKNSGGTGLGLAISKKIIEDHGGKIWVECYNNNVVFKFTIPTIEQTINAA